MLIAITGANGFIGNELAGYFLRQGHSVLLLQRSAPAHLPPGAKYLPYHLDNVNTIPNLAGVSVLIHTAYMPAARGNRAAEKNINGTLALYEECQRQGVDFIFLSSMSAHAHALSDYGKHKYEVEKLLNTKDCLVLKLGLVIGEKGLFSRIRSSVQGLGIAVMIGGGEQPIQTVYIKDVAKVIENCILQNIKGIYSIATPEVYTMKQLFRFIAQASGKNIRFIPVPYWLAETGVRMIEWLHLPFPVSNENLLGLKQLTSISTQADLDKLGIALTDLPGSIRLLS